MMQNPLLAQTRRHFFQDCGVGLGSVALGSLLAQDGLLAKEAKPVSGLPAALLPRDASHPLAPRSPHFPAKAKNVIFLFMAGGPSQFELFEPKPKLQQLHGEVIPPSYVANKRFAFIKQDAKLLGTKRSFIQYGESGHTFSGCLPHLAQHADDLTFLRAVKTDVFNHGPAKFFVNTGSPRFGRPSMGAWVAYGIGSECTDLPGFVVLQSGPRGPRGGAPNWGSGFLPTTYQGVPFRNAGDPILNLENPAGIDAGRQSEFVRAVNDLNHLRLDATGDGEIATRIAAYEMAFRMQSSAPELIDFTDETPATLEKYGAKPGATSFANNCLLARRLVQRGVRFVQLYHTDWDHHGNKGTELEDSLNDISREIDQPCAALLADLKQHGLLEDTLVVWGGEFGRTPQGEPRELLGRDHHIEAYTMWLAGAGLKPGMSLGVTDEIGYYGVEDQVHVHDIQATILHLLGLDHLKLTYRFQGRDFRLTDVAGQVIHKILA